MPPWPQHRTATVSHFYSPVAALVSAVQALSYYCRDQKNVNRLTVDLKASDDGSLVTHPSPHHMRPWATVINLRRVFLRHSLHRSFDTNLRHTSSSSSSLITITVTTHQHHHHHHHWRIQTHQLGAKPPLHCNVM